MLFIYLLLQSFLHSSLLSFSFVGKDLLLISSLRQNISVSLEFQIDSIFMHTPSSLDIWKVYLGDGCIERSVVCSRILWLNAVILNVEGLIIWVKSMLVRVLISSTWPAVSCVH